MPAKTTLNFLQMVRDFLNTALTGSAEIRERCDAISRLILDLVDAEPPVNPPDAPDGLGAVGFEQSVRMTWNAVENAATYNIYRSLNVAGPFELVGNTGETSYLDVGLADETLYFYYVTAVSINLLESEPSEISEAVTTPGAGPKAPTTPAGLEATALTSRSVELTWDTFDTGTVAARIERRRPSASVPTWVPVTESTEGTSFIDDRVNQNLTYEYRIAGLNIAGTLSAFSAAVSVTTPADDPTPPSVPENLTLTPGDGFITATCDPSPEPDTRGYIFAISSTTGAPYTEAPERVGTTITFPNLTNDTEYFFVVKSVDTSDNESAFSAEVSATVLSASTGDTTPPPRVAAINSGSFESGEVTVVWSSSNANDLNGYRLEVSSPPQGSATGPWSTATTTPAGTQSATVTGLSTQDSHHFRVISFDTTGNEALPSPTTSSVADGSDGPASVGTILVTPGEVVPDAPGGPSIPGQEGDTNDPILGITTDGTQGSTVLGYHYLSMDEKKNLFLPGMRGNRASRPLSQVSTQYQRDTCPSISNTEFTHSAGASIAYGTGKASALPADARPDGQAFTLENCGFTRFASPTNGAPKWGIQDYAQPASFTIDCDFESVATGPFGTFRNPDGSTYTPSGDELEERYTRRIEHDRYHHTSSSCIWKRVTSNFVGGHCFYVANRPYSYEQYAPDNPAATGVNFLWIDNCHLIDSNIHPSKGTNKIEVFDFGSPTHQSYMVIRNSTLVDSYPFYVRPVSGNALHKDLSNTPLDGWGRGKGLINVSGYQYCENPQLGNPDAYPQFNSPGGFGAGNAFMKAALIKNCILGVKYPLRNVCGFGGVEDVIFEDCTIAVENGTRAMVINENAYRADDPGTTRGLPRVETISFANCLTRNVRLFFKRLAGPDIQVLVPEYLVNRKITYDCSDGSVISNVAYDPINDATDVAAWINAADPFDGINGIPASFDWGIPGVTV